MTKAPDRPTRIAFCEWRSERYSCKLHIPQCSGPHLRRKAPEAADWPRLRQSSQIEPIGFFVWFTGVHVHRLLAVHAFDGAAPLELALAFGDAFHAGGVVATPTAHDLTAVHASG